MANNNQLNTDGDDMGDACDDDVDNDGKLNAADNCPLISNADQSDIDDDKQGDLCDSDSDGDGVPDSIDNCSKVYNSDQKNSDYYLVNDTAGDLCDNDWDNDGFLESTGEDLCPRSTSIENNDLDGDGIGDACRSEEHTSELQSH